MDDPVILTLVAILVLLVLSGFFSGSETALTAASRPRMHQLERAGDRRAGTVNRLRDKPERLIGAILLGNNLVNILASALATSVLIAWFGDVGVAYATIGMTTLIVIFAEVLPKSYALRNPDRMSLAIAPLMRPVVVVLSPFVLMLQQVVAAVLKVFGVKPPTATVKRHLEEELKGAIALHAVSDAEAKREGQMLDSVLDLADIEVAAIMIHRRNVELIDVDEPPAKIVEQVTQSPYTRLPLYRDEPDNIVGVLHAKDLLRQVTHLEGELDKLDVTNMASVPWFIPDTTSVLNQLAAFRRRREHFAVVVDEYGELMGILTLEDILEEIVGEIADEFDVPVAGVRPQRDGTYVIDGSVPLRDLNRQFDWHLPDEEATTIAGLVLHEARLIPEAGQVFEFHGFRFEILRRQRNQITALKVARLDAPDAGAEA